MDTIQADAYIKDALIQFGKEVNTNRQLVSILDGLKVVYRRVIYTALKTATNLTKTAAITGNTLSTVHPHGSQSVDDVIAALVRWGIFEGQGNFGIKMIYGDDIYPSAPRYTEARIDPKWRSIFSNLMDYVPYKEAELEGNIEPEFLPTPLPMVLMFSGLGIGYGVNSRYPMFTPKSLYRALISDDYNELEAPFGLHIDYKTSELKDLWDKGLGRVTYGYDVQKMTIASGDGVMISGSAEIFKPLLDKVFEEELDKGQVYILDQTSDDIPRVFVGRSKGVRAITQDDIYDTCKYACTNTRTYRLTVTDGNQAYCIPLKIWLKECYSNYLNTVNLYKADKISKLEFDYRVFDWLPIVVNLLQNNRDMSDQDIVDKINNKDCDLEVVKAIMRKQIQTLRNIDSTAKMKVIRSQINDFKNLDPKVYTDELINRL